MRGTHCRAHVHHAKVPIERHHVWPLGYHGPDTAANIVPLCANAHGDVHYLLEGMLKGRAGDLREYGPGIRPIARAGYHAVMAYAEALAEGLS